jgi:hypothetical protein
VPGFNTDHRQLGFRQRAEQPLRQRPGFQSNSLKVVGRVPKNLQQRQVRLPPSLPARFCPTFGF